MGAYTDALYGMKKRADWQLPYGVQLPKTSVDPSSMEAHRTERRASFMDTFNKQNWTVPAPLTPEQQQRRDEFNKRYGQTYGGKPATYNGVTSTLAQVPSVMADPQTYVDWNNDIGTWTNNAVAKIPSAPARLMGWIKDLDRTAVNGLYNIGTALWNTADPGRHWTYEDVMAMNRPNMYTRAAAAIDNSLGKRIAGGVNYINPFKRAAQVGNAIMQGKLDASAPTGAQEYSEYMQKAPGGTAVMGMLENAAADTAFMSGGKAVIDYIHKVRTLARYRSMLENSTRKHRLNNKYTDMAKDLGHVERDRFSDMRAVGRVTDPTGLEGSYNLAKPDTPGFSTGARKFYEHYTTEPTSAPSAETRWTSPTDIPMRYRASGTLYHWRRGRELYEPEAMLQWDSKVPVEVPDTNFSVGDNKQAFDYLNDKLLSRGYKPNWHYDSSGGVWHGGDARTVKAMSDYFGYGGGSRPDMPRGVESITHGNVKPRAIQVGNVIFGNQNDASLLGDLTTGGTTITPATEVNMTNMNGLAGRGTNALHALAGVPMSSRTLVVPSNIWKRLLGTVSGDVYGKYMKPLIYSDVLNNEARKETE